MTTSPTTPDGSDIRCAPPMGFRHSGQPAHYDARLDDPATPDRFLIHDED